MCSDNMEGGDSSETSTPSSSWTATWPSASTQETSAMNGECSETNTPSASGTPTWPLASPEATSIASKFPVAHQLPSILASPSASTGNYGIGSHSFSFKLSRTKGFQVGEWLVSDTFMAGGCAWAITFYPEGKKEQDKGYISLYIRLESDQTDVSALFELMLVDQSGKGKHKFQTQLRNVMKKRPSVLRHRWSQWGIGQYIRKKHLEKFGYLKDDCVVVNCKVEVLDFKEDHMSSLSSAAKIILETGSPSQLKGLYFDGNQGKFDQYLQAVDKIQQSIKAEMISKYETEGIDVIQMAMKTLQLVFRGILECSAKTDGQSSTTYSSSVTNSYSYELQEGDHVGFYELTSEQIYHLRNITKRLNSAGSLGDCIEVYRISRKSAVDARYLKFGIGKWSINDFRSSEWKESAAKIKLWIRAAHSCYGTIFPREKQNFEQIFDGVRAATCENCFLVIVKHVAMELSNFAEAITNASASFDNLFDILDLYEALYLVLPKIEDVFQSVSSEEIYFKATKNIYQLEDLVRRMFLSFEDNVLNEKSNTPLPCGKIHSLTQYAMGYIFRILPHKEFLARIIKSKPTKSLGIPDDVQFLEGAGGNPLGLHLLWIIICLKFNLEGKSKEYEDLSLRYFFFMNNVYYIVKETKGSPELLGMIGDDYPTKLSKDLLQASESYFASTWYRVLHCLRDDGLNRKFLFYNGISKNAVKDRLKSFNSTFDEVYQTQLTVLVPDIELSMQLHILILDKLIPAYESFLEQFRSHIASERYIEKYIKYSPEDLEDKVSALFLKHKLSPKGL